MSLRAVFQMDALPGLNPETDSSLALIEEGDRRGHSLYHYLPSTLTWQEGQLKARGSRLKVENSTFSLEKPEWLVLDSFDLLFIRQDPPFNMAYITSTYLLDHLAKKVLMVNNPHGIRQSPEKILTTHFADLMPPTLITSQIKAIEAFQKQYKDVVIKPLYEFGGESVVRLTSQDQNLRPILELFEKAYPNQPWMIQKFLPEIFEGDRRLFLIDGELIGGYSRLPVRNSIRSNGARGGTTQPVTLSDRDYEIAARLKPCLQRLGLFFVGIDVIGSYLTEINVTSPTGLQMLKQLYSINVSSIIWDKLENKCKIS